ncbi:hypothetical protein BT63DRAFT_465825 [Microthyrium microscopicum]|uniref:Uncharacterized protein n=1 Tax=Microthyrium microscopicum TaxID=703497 RepID=A0A6A6TU01_9PEZI|nr:hypothetical protein BT63DRAFT_465825 [Microthyrium microscopicum]
MCVHRYYPFYCGCLVFQIMSKCSVGLNLDKITGALDCPNKRLQEGSMSHQRQARDTFWKQLDREGDADGFMVLLQSFRCQLAEHEDLSNYQNGKYRWMLPVKQKLRVWAHEAGIDRLPYGYFPDEGRLAHNVPLDPEDEDDYDEFSFGPPGGEVFNY